MTRDIIVSAAGQTTEILCGLREERQAWEGKVKAAQERVGRLLNQIEEGGGGKKIQERLREREDECEIVEKQLADVQAEIGRITDQGLQAPELSTLSSGLCQVERHVFRSISWSQSARPGARSGSV